MLPRTPPSQPTRREPWDHEPVARTRKIAIHGYVETFAVGRGSAISAAAGH